MRAAVVLAPATAPPANSGVVYQHLLPSLVVIRIERPDAEGEEGYGVGSGVVVNANGDILTALHVVLGATAIEVGFTDGTRATATIAGADPRQRHRRAAGQPAAGHHRAAHRWG